LDLSQTHGWFASRARHADGAVDVLLTSAVSHQAATRTAARHEPGRTRLQLGSLRAVTPQTYDTVWTSPPGDRGNAVVAAHLDAAARALKLDGEAWVLLEDARGAKRYAGWVRDRFSHVNEIAKRAGYRLLHARDPLPLPPPEPPRAFDTPWGEMRAHPAAWSAGKLDPGAAFLLEVLTTRGDVTAGQRVWDLGCGFGPLARFAYEVGAEVTATDDEADAADSCRLNVPGARVLHGAEDTCLEPHETFNVVLLNPPHHVGAGVRRDLGRELVDVAWRRVQAGGTLFVVANAALPYERDIGVQPQQVLTSQDGRFRVLAWLKPA
jgi:16S rRNA G1207 methylase RsmC